MTVSTATPTANPDASTPGENLAEARDRTLSQDVIFHVLQNERRRLVLKYLQGREGQVRMRDVAEQVAAWEHDTTVEQLTSKQRQRVYIPLYQNHLTKLDDEGIIDYNQSRGIVERKPLADQLDPYLDAYASTDEEVADGSAGGGMAWERYYLGVSALGTSLITAKAVGLNVLSTLSGFVIGVVILALFSLVTLAQVGLPLVSGPK